MGEEKRVERRLRSRGEVTVACAGMADFSATIYDISVTGLGVVAAAPVAAGSCVRVESHGHMAEGVVRHCHASGDVFHIGIALDAAP